MGLSAPNHHTVLLSVVGTPTAPTHTVIGPPGPGNVYSNAGTSIAGNAADNPFLNQTIMFDIGFPPGVVNTSIGITAATFSFGTTAGNNVVGVIGSSTVPEPSS